MERWDWRENARDLPDVVGRESWHDTFSDQTPVLICWGSEYVVLSSCMIELQSKAICTLSWKRIAVRSAVAERRTQGSGNRAARIHPCIVAIVCTSAEGMQHAILKMNILEDYYV